VDWLAKKMIALEYNISFFVQEESTAVLVEQCDNGLLDYLEENIRDLIDDEIQPIWRIVKPNRHKL
jgi:hypothetical protein